MYVLRIGSVRGPRDDHPYADAEGGIRSGEWARDSDAYDRAVRRMSATWQSRRDAARLIEACLEDDTVEYEIFYGVSDNSRRWFDIDRARSIVGYEPQDSADEWDAPPESGRVDPGDSVALALESAR